MARRALAIEAANQLTPAGTAEPMARLVAVLDPAGAPEAVFTGQTAQGYLAAMIESDDVSVSLARGALRALHRLSLLTHDPDPTEPRAVRMHNLTGRAVLQTSTLTILMHWSRSPLMRWQSAGRRFTVTPGW